MKHLRKFKQFEAIGFKVSGDNRDQDLHSEIPLQNRRGKIGYVNSEDFDQKLISLIKKLKAMEERGEPGERDVAKTKLENISKKYKINIDKILSDSPSKLGFKFSWENIEKDEEELNDLDKEMKRLK